MGLSPILKMISEKNVEFSRKILWRVHGVPQRDWIRGLGVISLVFTPGVPQRDWIGGLGVLGCAPCPQGLGEIFLKKRYVIYLLCLRYRRLLRNTSYIHILYAQKNPRLLLGFSLRLVLECDEVYGFFTCSFSIKSYFIIWVHTSDDYVC